MNQPHDRDRDRDRTDDARTGRGARDTDPTEVLVVYEVGAQGTSPRGAETSAPQGPTTPWLSAAPRRRGARTLVAIGAAFALVVGLTATGAALGHQLSSADSVAQSSDTADLFGGSDGSGGVPAPAGPGAPGAVSDGAVSNGARPAGPGGATTRGTAAFDASTLQTAAATADQSVGIVFIETTLEYESSAAAGTGVILTDDGLILTNNHVIDASTAIRVTVASTGVSYVAQVVGTDASDDIAVLQLTDADGLTPADLDTSDAVAVGDAVTGVGNAGGTGALTAAAGSVTGLDETITAQNSDGSNAETMSDLIEVNADIQSGDSGGPLLNADGEVIGINTAASSGASDITGYAITIENALNTAAEITSGVESNTITIGYPSFLGVAVGGDADAEILAVVAGSPAAAAGLAVGDTITSVNGVAVTAATLSSVLQRFDAGETVTLVWVTPAGSAQTSPVTLTTGPAD